MSDEQEIVKALRSNQTEWETKYSQIEEKFQKYQTEKEAEIVELKEEIRDLMFYLDAQSTVAKSELKDEIVNGSILIAPASSTPGSSTSKKGRNKKK